LNIANYRYHFYCLHSTTDGAPLFVGQQSVEHCQLYHLFYYFIARRAPQMAHHYLWGSKALTIANSIIYLIILLLAELHRWRTTTCGAAKH
jgi:hypothetical protein